MPIPELIDTMTVRELNRFDMFFLVDECYMGTDTRTIYQVIEHLDEGVVVRGTLHTIYGALNREFYLPDNALVREIELIDLI